MILLAILICPRSVLACETCWPTCLNHDCGYCTSFCGSTENVRCDECYDCSCPDHYGGSCCEGGALCDPDIPTCETDDDCNPDPNLKCQHCQSMCCGEIKVCKYGPGFPMGPMETGPQKPGNPIDPGAGIIYSALLAANILAVVSLTSLILFRVYVTRQRLLNAVTSTNTLRGKNNDG
jgi:hypothetical protein